MTFDLQAALPVLVPKAVAWAEARAQEVMASGVALNDAGLSIATRVGVANPEEIRVLVVPELPRPIDPELQQAALLTGLLGSSTLGLALGHAIYLRRGHASARLLSHECRHVHQYEQAGSIAAYLPTYLQQIVSVGYENSPFEVDARAHELVSPGFHRADTQRRAALVRFVTANNDLTLPWADIWPRSKK